MSAGSSPEAVKKLFASLCAGAALLLPLPPLPLLLLTAAAALCFCCLRHSANALLASEGVDREGVEATAAEAEATEGRGG